MNSNHSSASVSAFDPSPFNISSNIFPSTSSPPPITNSSSTAAILEEPPVDTWCFDLLLFYRSVGDDDPQAKNVLAQLEAYMKFSFVTNGVITCCLAVFGLLGNLAFLLQLRRSNYFSRRLANHLCVLSVWDIALLLCCLCSYGIMCIFYGILPFFGLTAYLLYLFQPFASFCVTGTIWQVLAITVERYKAVARPLSSRKGQLPLRVICGSIAFGAFALNFLAVPFERKLIECYEFTQNGLYKIRTMIVQKELANNQYYAILAHLLPDVLFRAPTPILRTVGSQQIVRHRSLGRNSSVHLMLTLLSVKFVLCNTLYLFNTILMEVMGYGGKTSSQQTELEMEQYIRSLYLTDFSNCLLAIHSATNWLIFYKWNWPRFVGKREKSGGGDGKFSANFSFSSSNPEVLKSSLLDSQSTEIALKRFAERRQQICADILLALSADSFAIAKAFGVAEEREKGTLSRNIFLDNANLRKRVLELAEIVESVLNALAKSYSVEYSILEWVNLCRQIGYNFFRVNSFLTADQWKIVRTQLVLSLSKNAPNQLRWQPSPAKVRQVVLTNLQKAFTRTFNIALREMKNGACCALVDFSQRQSVETNGMILVSGRPSNAPATAEGTTPRRLIRRMTKNGGGCPAMGGLSKSLFSRASSSRDSSFSLIFPVDEKEAAEEKEEDEQLQQQRGLNGSRQNKMTEDSTVSRRKTLPERLMLNEKRRPNGLIGPGKQHSCGHMLLIRQGAVQLQQKSVPG
uniref:G-protein coupled receptors family 1 profile domain-containing protein n=1 Tax=Globodera rostochiensis TaxID=31243 RepID=A0A914HSH3_GLORO